MSDIRDPYAFIRSRWNWSKFGYERSFPRGIGFGDIDAHLEMNRRHLFTENKNWDGDGEPPLTIPTGQRMALESLVRHYGHWVLLLLGHACDNKPEYAQIWVPERQPMQLPQLGLQKVTFDWRELEVAQRRNELGDLFKQIARRLEVLP